MTQAKFNPEEFYRELCEHLVYRFPNIHYYVEFLNKHDETEHKENPSNSTDLARALTVDIPPLQRVLTFSMWMSRDFVRNIAGITDAELEESKVSVLGDRIYPAYSVTIQQWNTHTVIIESSGRQRFIYEPEPWGDWGTSYPIWQHTFETVDGPSKGGSLEVVFHDDAIKCWARHGRFQGNPFLDQADDKYLFLTIPLNESKLNSYLVPDNDNGDDDDFLFPRPKRQPWEKIYGYEDIAPRPDISTTHERQVPTGIVDKSGKPILKSERVDTSKESRFGWSLHILDTVARAIYFSG